MSISGSTELTEVRTVTERAQPSGGRKVGRGVTLSCDDYNGAVNISQLRQAANPVEILISRSLRSEPSGSKTLVAENWVKKLLRAGADKVSVNSAAVRDPDFVNRASDRFGRQCIVVGIDARRRADPTNPGWDVFVRGGRENTGLDAISPTFR